MSDKPSTANPTGHRFPEWQHGYRCHGYWMGETRVGYVGLSRRSRPPVRYSWECRDQSGVSTSLRGAKRAVQRVWSGRCANTEGGAA